MNVEWESVLSIVFPAIEERATKTVRRVVKFDEKHKIHMKQRYDRDLVGFWSVLDQVQERMTHSDWSNIHDDGRFIQSFITKSEPHTPLALSPFLYEILYYITHPRYLPVTDLEKGMDALHI